MIRKSVERFSERIMLDDKARTATRLRRLAAVRGEMWRPDLRPPSDSKSPRPVSRRGLNSCDLERMQVICPTGQVFLEAHRSPNDEAIFENEHVAVRLKKPATDFPARA